MVKKKYRDLGNFNNKLLSCNDINYKLSANSTLILKFLRSSKYPMSPEIIAKSVFSNKTMDLKSLIHCLNLMVKSNFLYKTGRYYRFCSFNNNNIVGKVKIINNRLFTIAVKKFMPYTIVLSKSQSKIVFEGDVISASISGLNKNYQLEVNINSFIERNTKIVIGHYFCELDIHFIKPIDKCMPKHILLIKKHENIIKPHSLVKANIVMYPSRYSIPVADFICVLKKKFSLSSIISIIIKKYNITNNWSKIALNTSNKLSKHVSKKDIINRIDLRHLPFVTIDDDDAKDFDDAIFVDRCNSDLWKLYVAISDVSYYVAPNSVLDREAQIRSTSIYFSNYVIPMFPETLSNGLCSLNPQVDRLALVCEIDINSHAKILKYNFYSAVINSKARFNYNEINDLFLRKNNIISSRYSNFAVNLFYLFDLYKILVIERKKRGAIYFNKPEFKIILNKNNEIESIKPYFRNDAHLLIEEFMLLVNSTAAEFIIKNNVNSIFRVHNAPTDCKVKDLQSYFNKISLNIKINNLDLKSIDYANILEYAKSRDDFDHIQLMILKSMNQAVYTPYNSGHFGLAYHAYTHFTSPIRRYPDLLVHRIIKSLIYKNLDSSYKYSLVQLEKLSHHASLQERNADAATFALEKCLKCHFISEMVGSMFNAKIVDFVSFGIFVELSLYYVVGLVHVSSLKSNYFFDDFHYRFIDKNSNKSYLIGQKVKVQLIKVNLNSYYIDCILLD